MLPIIMTEMQYYQLKEDVIDRMVEVVKKRESKQNKVSLTFSFNLLGLYSLTQLPFIQVSLQI